jgi:CubicO group peptidase (beta-lactamase class C family)
LLIPDIEAYIASGMKEFNVPGLAIGIVAEDKLVYSKGFGVRSKSSGLPLDANTIFQIVSPENLAVTCTPKVAVNERLPYAHS